MPLCGDGVAQVRADALERGFCGESVLCPESLDLAVLDELVGPANAHDGSFNSLLCEAFQNCGAEAAGEYVILEGDEQRAALCVTRDALVVDGLGEACVDDSDAATFLAQHRGKALGLGQQAAEREDRNVGSIA